MLKGVNLTGGEVSYGTNNTVNPVLNKDYLFISNQDIDYLVSKKVNFVRLLFSWEILQPSLNQPFVNSLYFDTFKERVDYLIGKDIYTMIEIHGASDVNFARYKGNVIGSTEVPYNAFGDLWARLATLYKNKSKVIFGLMNEPTNMGTKQWYTAAQTAINAIRATGATNMIMVPGNGWTGAGSWNDNWYDTDAVKMSNATGWLTLKDPLNNMVCSVHMYLDPDAGGGTTEIVSPTIGVERLSNVVDWAKANNIKVHLGEFAASTNNPNSEQAVKNVLNYIENNKSTIIGWAWWAYGPPSWWGNYKFTLCPTNNYNTDDPKWLWLTPYLNETPTSEPISEPTPSPTSLNIKPATTSIKAPNDQTFTSTKTFRLKAATRTTYSDETSVSVNIILSNDHAEVDIDWEEMTIELHGHMVNNFWNCTINNDSSGVITIKPVDHTKTIKALNKNSIGFSYNRTKDVTEAHKQITIKNIKW